VLDQALKDKIVIVTGGAGLIGKELIGAVVENGGHGIIADINETAAKIAAKELNKPLKDRKVDFIALDITSKNSINDMIQCLLSKYGRVDAIVNNAYPKNKNFGKRIEEVAYEDFCENVNLHLGGYFLVSQQMALLFKKQGYGNIVNIASIYGVIPPRFEIYDGTKMTMAVEYAAIKAAVIALTRYMAKYYKGSNIRINCISPGGILDNQPKEFLEKYNALCLSKGMLDKRDLNGLLVFLLSDKSQYINGQNIVIDDGFSL
jgi:NAD(P)-dependent dehydrogenase (short-subunit alcohol dehydrogenase family)